jgi:hypothetical protein
MKSIQAKPEQQPNKANEKHPSKVNQKHPSKARTATKHKK